MGMSTGDSRMKVNRNLKRRRKKWQRRGGSGDWGDMKMYCLVGIVRELLCGNRTELKGLGATIPLISHCIEEEEAQGEIAPSPPPSSSPTVRSLLDSLMLHPSTAPSPKSDGPADPSPDRGIEGTPPRSNDLKSVAAPEDSKDSGCGFILDSGVAEHATGSAELLSETRAPENGGGGASFRRRVGKDLPVVAVGSINTPRFAIPDVRHVPDLGTGSTLVSVRQLARRGLAVTFGSESCHIKEPSTGVVVGEGRLRDQDGFYYLDFLRIPQN